MCTLVVSVVSAITRARRLGAQFNSAATSSQAWTVWDTLAMRVLRIHKIARQAAWTFMSIISADQIFGIELPHSTRICNLIVKLPDNTSRKLVVCCGLMSCANAGGCFSSK